MMPDVFTAVVEMEIEPARVMEPPRLSVRTLRPDQIDLIAMAQWRDLAQRSCHHNPFLLPEFVLATWKHLTPNEQHEIVVVENAVNGRWLAAGCFQPRVIRRHFPVPHHVASATEYTFRTGLLLDVETAPQSLETLLTHLVQNRWLDHGVEFPGLRLDSILARELMAATHRLGFEWQTHRVRQVPVIFPDLVTDDYLQKLWSKSRRKTLRRCRSRLEETGPVQLHLAREPEEVETALETFLRLERDSWKGQEGTALLSQPHHAAFIRDAVHGLARHGNVILSTLTAGDRVAAAAINLTAGTSLFACKIGWDEAFADASPGVLHETELMRETTGRLSDFTLIDSCATETSYIASLWPERIPVGTGMICATPLARLGQRALNVARKVRSYLRKPKSQVETKPADQ